MVISVARAASTQPVQVSSGNGTPTPVTKSWYVGDSALMHAGKNALGTDKQYTFNRLALSLQSDLKSQIQEKSGDMIIGISELKSTGDRSYPVDQSNLDKDSDNNVNSDSLNV